MKECSVCGQTKSIESFFNRKGSRDGKQSKCKECHRERQLLYYRSNRDRVGEYKVEKGCVDCGYKASPYALDFDHLFDKKYTISQHLHRKSWDSLLEEISKCEVRCANCHRIKTAERNRDG